MNIVSQLAWEIGMDLECAYSRKFYSIEFVHSLAGGGHVWRCQVWGGQVWPMSGLVVVMCRSGGGQVWLWLGLAVVESAADVSVYDG